MGRHTQELVHIVYKVQNQEERAKPKLQANVTCTTVEYAMVHMWKKQYCEDWIGCDHCDTWFHMPCMNVQPSEVPDTCSKINL